MLRRATLSAACNDKYYASEHFVSQTGLQYQGPPGEGMKVRFFDLHDLGDDLGALLDSDIVRAALGGSDADVPSKEQIETCLGQTGDMAAAENHHDSQSRPGTHDIEMALRNDSAIAAMLREMYAMDYLCGQCTDVACTPTAANASLSS